MERLISILRQPLTCGGCIDTDDSEFARVEIDSGEKSELDLREIARACLEAAEQISDNADAEAPA